MILYIVFITLFLVIALYAFARLCYVVGFSDGRKFENQLNCDRNKYGKN
jgi:hypothetical protein